jgi:DNA-binding response OmpR family regulator
MPVEASGMKKQILVVDDEIGALTLIGIMLERGGFSVLKAKDGKTALAVLDQNTPDLIILDVMMPGMNGIELCRVVRERTDTAHTPVLILSARGDAESIMRGIEAGANDYLPKPILHHDLVAKVRLMLGDNGHEN